MLMGIFGPDRQELIRGWKKKFIIRNFGIVYVSTNIIMMQ